MTTSLWKGMIETVYSCEELESLPEKINSLREKLQKIEDSKTIAEIKEENFTEEEINYLNSPLLDEINKTLAHKNPLFTACQYNLINAVKFYLERLEPCEVLYNHLFITTSVEIMDLLLEKNPELEQYKDTLFKVALKLQHFDIVKALYKCKSEDEEHEYTKILWNRGRCHVKLIELLPEYIYTKVNFNFACMSNNFEVLKSFENKGFSLLNNINFLLRADEDIITYIIEKYEISTQIKELILIRVINIGNVEFLKSLLNKGYVLNTKTDYLANVSSNSDNMLKFLLSIEHINKNSVYLQYCLREDMVDDARLLYKYGIRLTEEQKENFLVNFFPTAEPAIIDLFLKYETEPEIKVIAESCISSESLKELLSRNV